VRCDWLACGPHMQVARDLEFSEAITRPLKSNLRRSCNPLQPTPIDPGTTNSASTNAYGPGISIFHEFGVPQEQSFDSRARDEAIDSSSHLETTTTVVPNSHNGRTEAHPTPSAKDAPRPQPAAQGREPVYRHHVERTR
jgi:hypothetical protein